MEPESAAWREEWCVLDESCNCRRTSRTRETAERILATGRLTPGRDSKGPLRLERRLVTDWERV